MNRYMSYQYSNNNFAYDLQPVPSSRFTRATTTTTATTTNSPVLANKPSMMTTTTTHQNQASKYQSSKYKSSELPWSSSLASSSRYPARGQTTTGGGSYVPAAETNFKYSNSAISSTLNGRSLFDYSSPRTAINTPASRIYDGQLRRTVTARYHRTIEPFSGGPSSRPASNQSETATSSNQRPIASNQSNRSTESTRAATTISALKDATTTTTTTTTNNNNSGKSPFRSSSLKLRTSYTHILDQLTSTTLAKLRLGPSSSNGHKANVVQAKRPPLNVVPDEPEPEEAVASVGMERQSHHLAAPARTTTVAATTSGPTTTSPGSSSSGLSSSGQPGASPTSSASSRPAHSPARPIKISNTVTGFGGQLLGPSKCSEDPEELKNIDSGHSNGDSGEDYDSDDDEGDASDETEDEDEDEDEEQHTLVSPVTRRIEYLSKELGPSRNNLACRDNLVKTGAILAELDKFEEDSDNMGRVGMQTSPNELEGAEFCRSAVPFVAINESELVLRPNSRVKPDIKLSNSTSFSSSLGWYQSKGQVGRGVAKSSGCDELGVRCGSNMVTLGTIADSNEDYLEEEEEEEEEEDDDDDDEDDDDESSDEVSWLLCAS